MNCVVRPLYARDIQQIVAALATIGGDKPESLYERYLEDQTLGIRDVLIAETEGQFAGYLTICWAGSYHPFRDANIPEIIDFNVLPAFRNMGIGTALLDEAERRIALSSPFAGIGVGLTANYGAAQRLYVKRGYVPDGRGITTVGDRFVQPSETVRADDDLTLHLTKRLRGSAA